MSKLIGLSAENIMCLKAVSFRLEGKSLVVGGENDAGKSTVLRLVQLLMGGTRGIPKTPVRRGTKKGEIVGETEELIAKRRFTANGNTSVEIASKATGEKLKSPQSIFDKLIGPMFDPADFLRSDPDKQVEIVRRLIGLDFDEHDKKRDGIYNERADANRDAKRIKAQLDAATHHDDAPPGEVSVAELTAELQQRSDENTAQEIKRGELRRVADTYRAAQGDVRKAEEDLVRAEKELAGAKVFLGEISKKGQALKVEVGKFIVPNLEEIHSRLSSADDANRKTRDNQAHAKLTKEHEAAEVIAKKLNRQLEDMDEEKTKAIAEANYPIDGLGVSDDCLTYGGLPLDQAGQASQLCCAVAIGLAVSPDFPVLAIRNGSELTDASLAALLAHVEKVDAQLLIERRDGGGDGKVPSVIIEDGEIVGADKEVKFEPARTDKGEEKKSPKPKQPEVIDVDFGGGGEVQP